MTIRDTGGARNEIMARITAALRDLGPPGDVPRAYRTSDPPGIDIIERFAERVADYRADVHRATEAGVGATVAAALAARGSQRIVVPDGVPGSWLSTQGIEMVSDDPPLSYEQLDATDTVVTGCAIAIAETGTIVLDAGPAQGRRVLSLLPDHHVCIVRADQIVGDVPGALAVLDPRQPLTWISGPSATSDIELDRVEGVHGPRKLDVVIVECVAEA